MRELLAGNRRGGRLLEAAAWTFGVLLILTYFGTRAYGEIERRQAVATFAQARSQPSQPPVQPVPVNSPKRAAAEVPSAARGIGAERPSSDPGRAQENWSVSRIRAHAAVVAESGESSASPPAALLRIRRVGLEVPVYADATERNLNRGAGLIAGTSAPDGGGNTGIAAHRDGYFRVLADVVMGDVLELETHSGQRRYRVTELSVVEPTDMSSLDATDVSTVTLVTCYPFYFAGPAPHRYIVRAVAVD